MCRVVTCSASRRRGSICPSPPRVGSRCRAAARMPGGYFSCPPACFHAWLFRNFRLRRWSEPGSVRGGRRSSGILRKGVARGPPQGGRPGSRRTDRESGVRLSAIPVPVGHRPTSKRNPPRGRRGSSPPSSAAASRQSRPGRRLPGREKSRRPDGSEWGAGPFSSGGARRGEPGSSPRRRGSPAIMAEKIWGRPRGDPRETTASRAGRSRVKAGAGKRARRGPF